MTPQEFLKSKNITKATCYTDGNKTYYANDLAQLMEEYASIKVSESGILTKQEHFASMAMQGLLAANMRFGGEVYSEMLAKIAVRHAEDLLKELEKKEQEN